MPRIAIDDLRVEADLTRQEQHEILGGHILPYIEQDNLYKQVRLSAHNYHYSTSEATSLDSTGGANFVFGEGSVRF